MSYNRKQSHHARFIVEARTNAAQGGNMASATMTIRLDSTEKDLITSYANTFGETVSEFMRNCALERIEDELDLTTWYEAKAEFEADPETISAAEIAKKYL
jgi:RHH-type transcriptional regulator, rel operon repressor / antitoxin RelB